MKKDIDRLMKLFEGFAGAHGTHGEPTKDGLKWIIKRTAKTLREPVTKELWLQHLDGTRPLGVIPIKEDSSCAWGSIDVDEYDVDIMEIVLKSESAKMPLVPCRSKSGGLHLFLFLDHAYPAVEVQDALTDAAAALGLAGCEIFPKQTKVVVERGDVPNWMIAPYFGGTFNDKLKPQHGLKKTGAEMSLTEFLSFAEKHKTTLADFTDKCISRRTPKEKLNGASDGKPRTRGKSPCDFTDGPPCLEYLNTNGVQKDGRKRTLFMQALYFKRASPEDWKSKLEQFNQHFAPPLPTAELQSVINSVEKKDYHYTCKEEPMRSHCNSRLCRSRKFGVGSGGELEPVITSLKKIRFDPPIWIVGIEGAQLELSTRELQNYRLFHEACLAHMLVYPPMKEQTWYSILSEVMKDAEALDAPPDAAPGSEFQELMETFLTDRATGERFEDVLAGKPWESIEEGQWYFQMKNLEKFLIQEKKDKDYHPRRKLVRAVEFLDGKPKFLNIEHMGLAQKGVNVWVIPSSRIKRIGKLSTPQRKKEHI